ncbi:MAG: hypothetical protein LBI71_10660 [Enterobacteriaceae bacterium]|jgi:hypothetical protein|nr:hypothetical protein [Enterobacteriaceae bacterium]
MAVGLETVEMELMEIEEGMEVYLEEMGGKEEMVKPDKMVEMEAMEEYLEEKAVMEEEEGMLAPGKKGAMEGKEEMEVSLAGMEAMVVMAAMIDNGDHG